MKRKIRFRLGGVSFIVYLLIFSCPYGFMYSQNSYINDVWESGYDYVSGFVTELLELREDRAKVSEGLSSAMEMGDKWFSRGWIRAAAEFYRVHFKEWPFTANDAEQIADQYFEKGYDEIAVEFDNIHVKRGGGSSLFWAREKADKWFKRGYIEHAIKFEKLSIEASRKGATIADEWFKRGYEKIAVEFDELAARKGTDAVSMANKWFERGNPEMAYYLSVLCCQFYPRESIKVFENWIKKGEFALAEEFANKVLEMWIGGDDDKDSDGLRFKLKLAAIIHSEYYYKKLKSKAKGESCKGPLGDYEKALKTIDLKCERKSTSVVNYLLSRIKVDPELLSKNKWTEEEFCKVIESSLNALRNESEITFSILHGIALHSKEDPYCIVNVLGKNLDSDEAATGDYSGFLDRIRIMVDPGISRQKFEGALIHEWSHQLMAVVYGNQEKPYRWGNEKAKSAYQAAIEAVQKKISEREGLKNGPASVVVEKFDEVLLYNESDYEAEYIVRLPQLVAWGCDKDPEAQEIMKPLYDYWMEYVAPDINAYIKTRAAIDNFTFEGSL